MAISPHRCRFGSHYVHVIAATPVDGVALSRTKEDLVELASGEINSVSKGSKSPRLLPVEGSYGIIADRRTVQYCPDCFDTEHGKLGAILPGMISALARKHPGKKIVVWPPVVDPRVNRQRTPALTQSPTAITAIAQETP